MTRMQNLHDSIPDNWTFDAEHKNTYECSHEYKKVKSFKATASGVIKQKVVNYEATSARKKKNEVVPTKTPE